MYRQPFLYSNFFLQGTMYWGEKTTCVANITAIGLVITAGITSLLMITSLSDFSGIRCRIGVVGDHFHKSKFTQSLRRGIRSRGVIYFSWWFFCESSIGQTIFFNNFLNFCMAKI
jgi:hypothetical protein